MSAPANPWRPIATAPRDGTAIQARIPGHGEDNVIAWIFIEWEEAPIGTWQFVEDQEPPDCWTDGICWRSNDMGQPSVRPTHWKRLP